MNETSNCIGDGRGCFAQKDPTFDDAKLENAAYAAGAYDEHDDDDDDVVVDDDVGVVNLMMLCFCCCCFRS